MTASPSCTISAASAAIAFLTATATSLFDDDIHAANTLAEPDRVTPRANESVEL